MADFCKQCSIEIFDQDFKELAGLTSLEAEAEDRFCVVICEGCGRIQVDSSGSCVSTDCLKHHGQS